MIVTLTSVELNECRIQGERRHSESKGNGLKDKWGFEPGESAVWQDINACCGELAAARAYGMEWQARINNFHDPDIGVATQVRTAKRSSDSLIIRDIDNPDNIYVLVIGRYPMPVYWVVGSIIGRRGKDERWRRAPNGRPPAYFVPQRELKKI
jgi:hypothetical protein